MLGKNRFEPFAFEAGKSPPNASHEGFVYWCNLKPPPHPEYTVDILALGLFGGLFCFCWEVKMNKS